MKIEFFNQWKNTYAKQFTLIYLGLWFEPRFSIDISLFNFTLEIKGR